MSHRDDIMTFLQANWTATEIFALDDVMTLDDLPPVTTDCVLLVDFPQAAQEIATIAVTNVNGFRDYGLVQLIVASPAGQGGNIARSHAEALRSLLKGRRIGRTVVLTVSTFSAEGLTDGKWQLWIASLNFYRDEF